MWTGYLVSRMDAVAHHVAHLASMVRAAGGDGMVVDYGYFLPVHSHYCFNHRRKYRDSDFVSREYQVRSASLAQEEQRVKVDRKAEWPDVKQSEQ